MANFSKIIVMDFNPNSREILKNYIIELLPNSKVESFGDYKQGFEAIKSEEKPLVFYNIDDFTKSDNIINEIKLYTTKFVITSTDYSTNAIVKAMRYGAKDFLPKPIIKEDLKHVLALFQNEDENTQNSTSKIITIYSNKGGIGKTTIATNLAVELSKATGDKVALIDLNLQLGDVSTFLNLNPSFDVSYTIKNLIAKKENTILNAFEKYRDTNLFVLSDPNYIEESESISPQQIDELFKMLRRMFPYIIIDMSSNIDPNSLKILDNSDWILFSTIVNIPAIRNCQRCLNVFKSRRYPNNKVKIILNRYMENDEIKPEDIETTLGEKIYWKIPNNYFSIMEAINKGIPVSEVNANSNIANSFRDLASKIADDIVEQTIAKYKN